MKISSVNIPKTDESFGLETIRLSRLEPMVFLAGKNGSGKTRILKLLAKHIRAKPLLSTIQQAQDNLEHLQKQLKVNRKRLSSFPEGSEGMVTSRNRRKVANSVELLERQLSSIRETLEWNFLETDRTLDTKVTVVNLVPKSLNLLDYRTKTPVHSDKDFEAVKRLGISGLENGALIYLHRVQTRAFNATHPGSGMPTNEAMSLRDDFKRLNELIQKFLGASLLRDIDGNPTLYGKTIPDAELSDGQKILLQLCVQIHSQSASLENLIVMMDEPENHLHPAASIDMINAIKRAAPDCQLWIATHSLPILSFFTDATLLFVEKGKVRYAGSTPEDVLDELVGGDERVQKLRDFTSLPGVYAMNRYAAECLLPPVVVGAQEKDDQTSQIKAHLTELQKANDDRKLRVLDFGAGKGRLLESLADASSDISKEVEYYAFDEYTVDSDICNAVINSAYGDCVKRHFTKMSDLTAAIGKGFFDVVVLCNVLHEIDPKDWLHLFSPVGTITSLLSDNGVLLLVEDEEIPVGEKADTKGFIVFDTTELRDLFKIRSEESFLYSDHRNDGRLKAHIIKKEWLKRVTAESRKSALEERNRRAHDEVRKLRAEIPSYKNGRKHSFWIQQLANSSLALSEL